MVTIVDEPTIIDLKTETAAEPSATELSIEPAEPAEPAESVELPTPKRKPGRPVGAKSKEPGKPRAKRVILKEVVEEPPIAQEPDNVNAYTMRIPTSRHECVYNDTSAKMLQMLAEHSQSRKKRKTDLWRSWFN